MILLDHQNLLFLKSRKVGGTSFEIALSKFACDRSIITPITPEDETIRSGLGYRGPQNHTVQRGDLPFEFFNHISASSVQNILGPVRWNNLFKISIIRNPFDAAISRYFWSQQPSQYSPTDFEDFCLKNQDYFILNRHQYLIEGKNIIDFYIRYENMESDVLALEDKLPRLKGLFNEFSKIKAKGNYRPRDASVAYMFSSAPKAKTLISKICDFEIQNFNYTSP